MGENYTWTPDSYSWSPDSGTWWERSGASRICAVPGCGAWADVEIRGLALCRDCTEAFARAYRFLEAERHPVTGGER